MSNTSRTDWARIDAMSDENIDTSDIPPLSEEFFALAQLRLPKSSFAGVFQDDPDFAAIMESICIERTSDDDSEVDPSYYLV